MKSTQLSINLAASLVALVGMRIYIVIRNINAVLFAAIVVGVSMLNAAEPPNIISFDKISNICEQSIEYPIKLTLQKSKKKLESTKYNKCKTKKTIDETNIIPVSCKTRKKGKVYNGLKRKGYKLVPTYTTVNICVPGTKSVTYKKKICLPGTDKTYITIPSSLKLDTKKLSICDNTLSKGIKQVIDKSKTMSSCMGNITSFIDDGFADIMNNGDMNQATSQALTKFADISTCIADNGFKVKEDKDNLLVSVSEQNSDMTLFAEEIDTKFYIDLITRLSLCTVAADCDPLLQLFLDYFEKSQKAITSSLVDAIEIMILPIKNIQSDFKLLSDNIVKDVKEIENIMKESNCTLSTKKFTQDLEAVKKLEDIFLLLKNTKNTINKIQDLITQLNQLNSKDYRQVLIHKVITGELPDFGGVLDFVGEVENLKVVSTSLSTLDTQLKKVIKILPTVQETLVEAKEILDTCNSNKTKNVITKIQSHITKINELIANTKDFNFNKFELIPGIATYQRWVDVKFDMPCSKKGNICLKMSKYKKCMDYPKLYTCSYEKTVPFPNHHIPYLKIKIK